jgi:hypothetical protein
LSVSLHSSRSFRYTGRGSFATPRKKSIFFVRMISCKRSAFFSSRDFIPSFPYTICVFPLNLCISFDSLVFVGRFVYFPDFTFC